MMNGIVALHLPPMRKDDAEKNGRLFCSVGCVGSRRTSKLFTLKFKHVGAKGYPALLLRSNRSLLMLLRRRFAFSSLWTGALVDTGREQAKRVVRNGKKETTTSLFCWIVGANTVVSDQEQELIRIWILTCRWFLTVGILPGKSNLVPQDPISAIHPPCIYAKVVASAMGFGLYRSKMMNGIVALHSPPMRKDDAEKNGRLFRSAGCKPAYVALAVFRLLFALDRSASGHGEGAGILPGSWWAHHELGRGGWWFRDPMENASFMPWESFQYVLGYLLMDELHRAVAPFIHSSGGGLPGGSMGHDGGRSPLTRGVLRGNENADPADMGATEQHQTIARREWDELRSSRDWISVENHFARYDRKIEAIFEKARSMYRDGQLALDIEDKSDIKRGLDAYFSNLHDFPSNGHRFRRLKLVVLLLPSLTSKGKGVKLNASLAHSERISALAEVEKGEEGTSRLKEEALREQEASLSLSERPIEREAVNQLSGLGLLVSEGCFGKAYERLSFDGRSIAGREKLIPGVKDGSSSLSALLAVSLQLSSKCCFPVESKGAVDGRGITGLFGSMVGKLSSLERIDRQAAFHAVTIEKIRVEISESSPLRPYISSLSLAKKKESEREDISAIGIEGRETVFVRSDRFLIVVGTALVHFNMQGRPSGRIKGFLLCKAINALVKIFSS
nr:cytochrome c biogenesis FN, mitochondrial [Tanacetum cinerariifolium]